MQPWFKYRKYPYYRQNDIEFQSFMIMLTEYLEPRFFCSQKIIFEELDEV